MRFSSLRTIAPPAAAAAPTPAPPAAPRRPLPRGTRLLWLGVLAGLCGVLFLRMRQARTQSALAEHQVSMHDAAGVLETKLGARRGTQRQNLAMRYASDPSPALRYASIDILAEQPSALVIARIEQDFTDPASEVRKRAMEKLIDLPGAEERGFRLLLAGLRDDDTWIREDASTQLNQRVGKRGSPVDKRAVPALMTAITDPVPAVSANALRALTKLTGHAWMVSSLAPPAKRQQTIAQWQAWWRTAQKQWPAPPEFSRIAALAPTRSDAAPDFALQDIEGRQLSNDDLKGKITLLNFWGTWCNPCQAEIPDLVRLNAAYSKGGAEESANGGRSGAATPVAIIGLACNEKGQDSLRDWCRAHHVLYRQALAENDFRKTFGDIEEVPVSFLLDAQGRIRCRWDGDRDFATFHAAIERLRHEAPNAPQTQ